MNSAKKSRAGLPEMPLGSWGLSGTKNFHQTILAFWSGGNDNLKANRVD